MKIRYRVAAILGLECGKQVFEFLSEHENIELVTVYALSKKKSKDVAGFIDFSSFVPKEIFEPYDSLSNIEKSISGLQKIDVIFAIGISEIIKEPILSASRLGCIGVHAALLPDRPGCSPVVWAILDGLTETAVTLFRMEKEIDSGPIFDVEKIKIGKFETAGQLRKKCDAGIIKLLERSLNGILIGKNRGTPQKSRPKKYTRKRGLEDGEINLLSNAESILRKINALSSPYPGAHFYAGDGYPIIIEKARLGGHELLRREPKSNKNILCVVAHPDDEALGVGGTLIRHSIQGDNVQIIIVSEGESAKSSDSPFDPERMAKAQSWCNQTGCTLRASYGFFDQKLDQTPLIEIIHKLEIDIYQFQPDVIYTHHPADMNSDHGVVSKAVLASVRPMKKTTSVNEILAFETPSSTEQAPNIPQFTFMPTHYVDITGVWQKKILTLAVYDNELRSDPHPRSVERIKSLAMKRGAESGLDLAEAFVVLRRLWRDSYK